MYNQVYLAARAPQLSGSFGVGTCGFDATVRAIPHPDRNDTIAGRAWACRDVGSTVAAGWAVLCDSSATAWAVEGLNIVSHTDSPSDGIRKIISPASLGIRNTSAQALIGISGKIGQFESFFRISAVMDCPAL
jgi:hypothetical protein